MFFIRLKIRNKCTKNIIVIHHNNYPNSSLEIIYSNGFLNKYTNIFQSKVCIPFSQTNKKIIIIRYEKNNEIIYKYIEYTNTNKNKHIIDLDDINNNLKDELLINKIENKLILCETT
jgi:hypothetical protein